MDCGLCGRPAYSCTCDFGVIRKEMQNEVEGKETDAWQETPDAPAQREG